MSICSQSLKNWDNIVFLPPHPSLYHNFLKGGWVIMALYSFHSQKYIILYGINVIFCTKYKCRERAQIKPFPEYIRV